MKTTLVLILVVALSNLTLQVLAVRSQGRESRRLIKGVAPPEKIDRRLQTNGDESSSQHHRNTGGLLRAFDQVWADSSSVQTATLISKCVKPKKSKKGSNLIGAASVSGKSGKAGGTTSLGATTADSSNDTPANSVITSGDGGSAVTASGKGSLRSSKKKGLPICGELDQNGNIIEPGTETLAPETGSAPSASVISPPAVAPQQGNQPASNENSQPTVIPQPGNQPASNVNSQPTVAPQQGNQPASNQNSQPTVAPQQGNQPASNQNSQPTVAPQPVNQPASNQISQPTVAPQPGDQPASKENSQPTVAPVPTVPTISSPTPVPASLPSAGVLQASVCDAYTAGTAPTSGPRQDHLIHITLNVVEGANLDSIYKQMGIEMRNNIAPLLLNCVDSRRLGVQRQLQNTSTELVNLVLNDPFQDTAGNCTQPVANTVCFPSTIKSNLYYIGDKPIGFEEKLRQAILFWTFNVEGLKGFGNVTVDRVDNEGGNVNPSDVTPTPVPLDRGIPPVAITGIQDTQASGNGVNPGAFVATAVAALTLVLVALFVIRRHRDKSSDSISKHQELTDDEIDLGNETDEIDLGNETDDYTTMTRAPPPPQKSYVVGDTSVDGSWITSRSAGEGQEVYAAAVAQHPGYADFSRTREQEDYRHDPYHNCSSPNCVECEMKRQSGTKFVAADHGIDTSITQHLPPREYEADDTVSL